MVGISNLAFRDLVRSYLPPELNVLIFTEMLSTRRIPSEKLSQIESLRGSINESFFIPQLLGNEEKFITTSVKKLLEISPWGFDINMGCTARQILQHNWGVNLTSDPEYAANIVSFVRNTSPLPLSVKLRTGDFQDDALLFFVEKLILAGADWFTFHPRTISQKHKGEADFTQSEKIAKQLNTPIVVNGNIQTAKQAVAILNNYKNIAGVMLARAAVAKPWIIAQIAAEIGILPQEYLTKIPNNPLAEGQESCRAFINYATLLKKYSFSETDILERVSFAASLASPWYKFGHFFWKLTKKVKSFSELLDGISEFEQKYENPTCDIVNFI